MVMVILDHMAHYGLQVLEQHLRCVRHVTNNFEDEFVEGGAPFISDAVIPGQFPRCFLLFREGPDII